MVLCPGSRSGPIAIAAGYFARAGRIELKTAIDERSAAFFALGLSTSKGIASAVVTTSGSAVANLLPASIEADRSCQPIIFLTADRPLRLKECGANQTVNQEEFLRPSCRCFLEGPREGLHLLKPKDIDDLVGEAWERAHYFAGPVHINLPLEEPLLPRCKEQEQILNSWSSLNFNRPKKLNKSTQKIIDNPVEKFLTLDPNLPGVIVVGPWRGLSQNLKNFQEALMYWQAMSGWPIFADPLSGIKTNQPGLIYSWEMLLTGELHIPNENLQVMRLGPMPASRNLERWLLSMNSTQLLITEGDRRNLDPLGNAQQWSRGLVDWLKKYRKVFNNSSCEIENSKSLFDEWRVIDEQTSIWLDKQLPLKGSDQISEPALARWVPRFLFSGISIMLAASSPVRDWIAFSGFLNSNCRCFGFRGASGIDGTLSLSIGLAIAHGPTVLVTGDLALLHDSNGWLLAKSQQPPLVVLLIDNGGGGIFNQLQLNTGLSQGFEDLFAMPQGIDQLSLADVYQIPNRQVNSLEALRGDIEWGLSLSRPVLLRVCTHREKDASLRFELRNGLHRHLQNYFKNDLFKV